MSIEMIALLMLGITLLLLLTGLPLAFVLGATGIGFLLFLEGPHALILPVMSIWGLMNIFVFIAVPLFIFMGVMLERSGVADDLFEMIYRWAGPVRGGLAIGMVLICVIFAAMAGTSGAATVSLGLIAIPSLIKRGYDKSMVTGTIQAGGALGFLIPPSAVMIIYGMLGKVSVGRLFAAGVFPGMILAGLFIAYIGVRCLIQPKLGPAMPPEERTFTLREKLVSTRALALPALLIVGVLGTIAAGICSPTEASAIGAAGALVVAAVHRRLSVANFKDALYRTARMMGMIVWVAYAAIVYSTVFDYFGGTELIAGIFTTMQLGPWGVLIIIQLSFFLLGMFLDDTAILFVCMPIYIPLVAQMGFDPVWFGVLYVINMQMAYITPPFGYNLFYMKGIAADLFSSGDISKEISLGDIYRSIIPFVALQAIGLAVVMIFPQVALWLPNKLFGS